MSHNPTRVTCRCGQGKVSAWDGKCGHCRTLQERKIHARLLDGWPRDAAKRGYLTTQEKVARRTYADVRLPPLPT